MSNPSIQHQLETCRQLLAEARNDAAKYADELAVVIAQRDRLAAKLAIEPESEPEQVGAFADQAGRIELCWDCHQPLGDEFVGYLPTHWKATGGSIRNAHTGCVPEGATVVGSVAIEVPDA
jgi:hypothetical protein